MKSQPSLPPRRQKLGNFGKSIVLAAGLFLVVAAVQGLLALHKPRPLLPAAPRLVATGQVTLTNYAYLIPGLLYTQASELLGGPGIEVSARDSAGTHTAVYRWPGAGQASLQVVFENDRLVRKAQVGLR